MKTDREKTMNWQRARSEEQKEQRISEIVDATARLYRKYRFEDISFSLIAKEAGFTRSNLYKYFPTKEEIFLEFARHDLILWREDLLKAKKLWRTRSVESFSAEWVEILARHKRLLDLFSILPTFLERNVTEESLVKFKRHTTREVELVSEHLHNRFPAISLENAGEFLHLHLAAAIGLYQMTNLSDLQQKVLDYPEFQQIKRDFTLSLQKTVAYLLNGLMN